MTMRPAKTQISLGIHPVWSESSLCAQWVAKDPSFLHADSEDPDQTGRMCHEAAQISSSGFDLIVESLSPWRILFEAATLSAWSS